MCENIKRMRAEVTQNVLKPYFDHLKVSLEGVSADCIINYDESNFCDDPGSSQVISKRGKRHADRVIDSSKQSTSVTFAITASGKLLPPYTVYKAKYLYDPWMEGGVEGATYNCNKSGWFDMTIFDDWFLSVVAPYCRRLPGKKLLMGDNLSSHLSVEVVQKCEELGIKFVLLPPNATHLLQPLDVSFFRPVKIEWRRALLEWKLKNRGTLPKTEFPRMLRKMLENMGEERIKTNAQSGFRACGVVPFNPDIVMKKVPSHNVEEEAVGDLWTGALINHLDKLRGGKNGDNGDGKSAPSSRKGKRRTIQAGKSLSVHDIIGTVMAEQEDSPESAEIEDEPEEPSAQPSTSNSSPVPEVEVEKSLPVPNDFVLVELPFDKKEMGSRFFVGQILSIVDLEEDEGCAFQVKFMRKKAGQKCDFFVFPAVEDIDTVGTLSMPYYIPQ